MKTGTVKWFNSSKGFGFLVDDKTGKEIFVHYTSIKGEGFKDLKEDQKVTFRIIETERGLQAAEVTTVV